MASSVETLRNLPVVFSTADFVRVTATSDSGTRSALLRLTERNWIKPAGPRTGLFYNLFLEPRAAENRALEAVRRLYPSATVVGTAVLHAHGWTTQIPHETDVAVLTRRSVKQFDGIHLIGRTRPWFVALMHSGELLRTSASPFPVESVTPAFALVDARQYGDVWLPDPDDLELPD